jgi:tetratricopeptide (TPR) repeat protein
MLTIGDPITAQEYSRQAEHYAEHLGHIYSQAESIHLQARCQTILGHFQNALSLMHKSRKLLDSCGLQQTVVNIHSTFLEADLHMLKTEYQEALQHTVSLPSMLQPKTYLGILADLNIVLIETATGVDFKLVLQRLDACRLDIMRVAGLPQIFLGRIADQRFAELSLLQGNHNTANTLFSQTLASSLNTNMHMEGALICLERLADLSTGMNNVQTTLHWAGIFLGLALQRKEKLPTLKAVRCLGQIFCAQGDDETALCLFRVALDGFTAMDIHRWRADCMVRIADIIQGKGEILDSIGLWKTARPLFERSSQIKDIIHIYVKLAAADAATLEELKKQLLRLKELEVPTEMSEGGYTRVDVVKEE